MGSDSKGKLSLTLYVLGIPLAFFEPWIAIALYVAVALMWLVPDRRIESQVSADARLPVRKFSTQSASAPNGGHSSRIPLTGAW